MNSIPKHRAEHRYEEISLLAYHLWQQAHCPPGEDLKFWLQAEEQLFGKHAPQSAAKGKAAASAKATAKHATTSAGNGAAKPAATAAGKSQSKAAKQQARAN
jgi:hypothetical protein